MDVDYFGPGYVSRKCLESGIEAYISKHKKYDAILMTTSFLCSIGDDRTRHSTYSSHRGCIPYYKINDALQCCRKIYDEAIKLSGFIKIYEQADDFCSIKEEYSQLCCELMESGFYMLSWPKEYMCQYSQRDLAKGLTNYGYWLCEKYEENYIPIALHAVDYHEVFIRNFLDRDFDWCVPGNRSWSFYSDRLEAYDYLKKKTKIWKEDPYQKLATGTINKQHLNWYQFRNKYEKLLTLFLGKNKAISTFPKTDYIAACRELYLESMRSSKYVYCEGGVANCFVRKYFESCACGSVLVAKRIPGMEQMGFLHDKNCIVVSGYKDIKCIQKDYSEEQTIQIAKAGQQLILKKHMFHHRAEALERTINMIKQGGYKGAYWDNGNYVLK
ncbi:MAG: glycosyltransferase [bacterium]|nr:glycosyltransferase [bacterium]